MSTNKKADDRNNHYRRLCVLYVQTRLPEVDAKLKAEAFKLFPGKRATTAKKVLPTNV
jgi:hypothetical protein